MRSGRRTVTQAPPSGRCRGSAPGWRRTAAPAGPACSPDRHPCPRGLGLESTPGPVSSTRSSSMSPPTIPPPRGPVPGPGRREMPCRMAFSTSGCSSSDGTSASSASGSISPLQREPVAEADVLDLEVAVQDLELLAQRHDLLPVIERQPQQVAEQREHAHHTLPLALHRHHRDRVQRIEQEVRVQLHAQRVEIRPRQARLEARRLQRQLRGLPLPLPVTTAYS
jgi:hypothetical protein